MSRKLRKVSALALESGDGLDFSNDDVADPTYNIEGEKSPDEELYVSPVFKIEREATKNLASSSTSYAVNATSKTIAEEDPTKSSRVSVYGYKFKVYSGQENICTADEPYLGASSNVVVRLSRDVPTNENYRLLSDNYYTSIPLIEYLSSRGILALGTIRRTRIPNCKLPEEKVFKKEPRGTLIEQIGD